MELLFFLEISVKSRHKSKFPTYPNTMFNYEPERMFKYIARLPPFQDKPSELSWLCSGNMPGWGTDAIEFWKAVEKDEIKNGVLYRHILFALPIVLSKDQKIALTEKFVKEVIGDRVHPYTYAIHEINGGNPHCHLIFSERMNDGLDRTPKNWFRKTRMRAEDKSAVLPLKSPSPDDEKRGTRKAHLYGEYGSVRNYYLKIRKLWETTANKALEEAGCPERIDCRSFEARGIPRIKQILFSARDKAIEKSVMEKLGIKTQKRKLYDWIEEASNVIKLIKEIIENSNREYGMDMFELGETKTWIEKKFKSPKNKDVQKIIKDFFRKRGIEKRTKKNITDMGYKIDEIKKIKKMIEDDDKEWEKEHKTLGFVGRKIKEFGRVISLLENNMKEFDEEQKEWIEYLEKEIADYFIKISCKEQLEARMLEIDYDKGLKDFFSKLDFADEPEDYIPAIYIEYKGKSGIIKLGKEGPNAQHVERMALIRYYEYLKQDEVNHPFTFREAKQAEIKSFLAKAEQSDTTKETEQKENQKISSMPKLVHNDDKIRIEKYLKDDTPFLGIIRIGNRYMLDGHLVDTKDYSIDWKGIVRTKYGAEIPLQKMDKQPDTKRVVIYEEDDPKTPKVVSVDDYFMIKKYLKDKTPFLVIIKISSYRYSLDGRFVDIKNYSIDYKGIVRTKDGVEIPPESLRLLRLHRKQSEGIHPLVDDFQTKKIKPLPLEPKEHDTGKAVTSEKDNQKIYPKVEPPTYTSQESGQKSDAKKATDVKVVTPKTDDKALPPKNTISVQLNEEKRKKTLTEALVDARRRDKSKRERALKKMEDYQEKAKPIDAVNKDDKERVDKFKESGKPFVTTTLNENGEWEIVEGYNGADKEKYELGWSGSTAILKEYSKKDGKSSEVEADDKTTTKQTVSGAQLSEEEEKRKKELEEISAELRLGNKPAEDKKTKTDAGKSSEVEADDKATTKQTVPGVEKPKEVIPNQQDLTQHSDTKQVTTTEKIKQKDDQKIPPVVLGEYKSDTKDVEKGSSGTTEKDAQEIPPMPKVVHEDDKVRIKEFKKDDIAFLTVGVNQKNGNWELKEGHLVDKNDFEINSEGCVKRKGIEEEAVAPLPNLTQELDTKQVTTTEKSGQKDDQEIPPVVELDEHKGDTKDTEKSGSGTTEKDAQEIPPMPKVVHEDDKVRIKEFKKDDIAFLTVGVNQKNGNWELKEGYLVDKNDFEINSEGRVKRKGIEEEAVAPLPNLAQEPEPVYKLEGFKLIGSKDTDLFDKYFSLKEKDKELLLFDTQHLRYGSAGLVGGKRVDEKEFYYDKDGIVRAKDGDIEIKYFEEPEQEIGDQDGDTPQIDSDQQKIDDQSGDTVEVVDSNETNKDVGKAKDKDKDGPDEDGPGKGGPGKGGPGKGKGKGGFGFEM